jgi:hypothetical protein
MTELAERMVKEARLRILKELAQQVDGRLSSCRFAPCSTCMASSAMTTGSPPSCASWKPWARSIATGTVLHAKILRAGRDHIEERAVIEGILRHRTTAMTGAAPEEEEGGQNRREGRGRLSTIDLLPEEAEEDVVWALEQLRERKLPQNVILPSSTSALPIAACRPCRSRPGALCGAQGDPVPQAG